MKRYNLEFEALLDVEDGDCSEFGNFSEFFKDFLPDLYIWGWFLGIPLPLPLLLSYGIPYPTLGVYLG